MVLFIVSFLCAALLLLPTGMEIFLIPVAAALIILTKCKTTGLMKLANADKKTLIGSVILSFVLFLYYTFNCVRRESDIDMMILIAIGMALMIMSVPFVLQTAAYKRELPSYEENGHSARDLIFSLITGFVTIGLLSQSSPLYPMNTWSDANCFLTLGRAQLQGVMIYRDVFDHKGPLLYLIHSAAALISSDSFLGMYIIQSVLCACTHGIMIRISGLFTKTDKANYILSVPFIFLLYSVNAYYFGDSAEEILLPFIAFGLYSFFKVFRTGKDFSKKDMILLGTGAAFAFWIKFTLCGYWIALIIFLIVTMIRQHNAKKLGRYALWFALPCIILSAGIIIYHLATSTLGDMFTVYFYNNIFGYQSIGEGNTWFEKIPFAFIMTFMKLDSNHVLTALILSAVVYFLSLKDKRYLAFYLTALAVTSFFVFFGDSQMFYYVFALAGFAVPGAAVWMHLVRRAFASMNSSKLGTTVMLLAATAFCAYSFAVSCSTYSILKPASTLPQHIFASYMDTSENVSILNYDFPDRGFITAADSVPTERYFCTYMIDPVLEESPESRRSAVEEGRVEYVITSGAAYDWENYEIISVAQLTEVDLNEHVATDTYILYRRK